MAMAFRPRVITYFSARAMERYWGWLIRMAESTKHGTSFSLLERPPWRSCGRVMARLSMSLPSSPKAPFPNHRRSLLSQHPPIIGALVHPDADIRKFVKTFSPAYPPKHAIFRNGISTSASATDCRCRPPGMVETPEPPSPKPTVSKDNIYPREIEEFLHGHPKIADVYVTGLPDERFGETVLAWIKIEGRRKRHPWPPLRRLLLTSQRAELSGSPKNLESPPLVNTPTSTTVYIMLDRLCC